MTTKLNLLLLLPLSLCGCLSPSEQFYAGYAGRTLSPYKGPVQVSYVHSVRFDPESYSQHGDTLIGTTVYTGRIPSRAEMQRQARKVGADLVLFASEYHSTDHRVATVTVPNPPQQVTSYSSGTIYGNGGTYGYGATTTTTVPGGYSSYDIPYSVTRYNVSEAYVRTGNAPRPAKVD